MLPLKNAIYEYNSTKEKEWYYNQFKGRIDIMESKSTTHAEWSTGECGIIFCHDERGMELGERRYLPYIENIPVGERYMSLSAYTRPWKSFKDAIRLAEQDPEIAMLSDEEYMRYKVHTMD